MALQQASFRSGSVQVTVEFRRERSGGGLFQGTISAPGRAVYGLTVADHSFRGSPTEAHYARAARSVLSYAVRSHPWLSGLVELTPSGDAFVVTRVRVPPGTRKAPARKRTAKRNCGPCMNRTARNPANPRHRRPADSVKVETLYRAILDDEGAVRRVHRSLLTELRKARKGHRYDRAKATRRLRDLVNLAAEDMSRSGRGGPFSPTVRQAAARYLARDFEQKRKAPLPSPPVCRTEENPRRRKPARRKNHHGGYHPPGDPLGYVRPRANRKPRRKSAPARTARAASKRRR